MVTGKPPVGYIPFVTGIRSDTTFDHSQQAENVNAPTSGGPPSVQALALQPRRSLMVHFEMSEGFGGFAAVRNMIEHKLHQDFYNAHTKATPPSMPLGQLLKAHDVAKIDWADWNECGWMKHGWTKGGVKMQQLQCMYGDQGGRFRGGAERLEVMPGRVADSDSFGPFVQSARREHARWASQGLRRFAFHLYVRWHMGICAVGQVTKTPLAVRRSVGAPCRTTSVAAFLFFLLRWDHGPPWGVKHFHIRAEAQEQCSAPRNALVQRSGGKTCRRENRRRCHISERVFFWGSVGVLF